ncbi:MAG: hypothetical protein B7Y89_09080 [Novosphingobium sp. 32-60-15]|uniref:ribbon-helix-helix domain-containing protein n=1 Tax=unclassified Novosphingobium TaxID=2644732 RepID=UPI000BD987F3|nr:MULTISPECIES: hypothetical protein [unclassified Novosphingobium]OYX62373.1 MAG: hypothetical protein B7Y89_09080 [Novosphingobium sp. 32-60-15]
MTDLSFSIPSPLHSRIEHRATEAGYADVGDYVRDLIERDLEGAADQTAWLRAMIQEGLDSGISPETPETIIETIISRRNSARD